MVDLGVLSDVDIRQVWSREEKDFTSWLRANIGRLNEALDLDIEIIEQEGDVGPFSVDLVGKDLSSGRPVIIENQLNPTDHGHLGQLITYAGGREAKVVIWISPQFREQHRQALDWLNKITGDEQAFFGVEIKVVQIDGSRPASLFKVVSSPNDWQKNENKRPVNVTGKGSAYREFWTIFLEQLKENSPGLTNAKKGSPQNWCAISAGRNGFSYSVAFKSKGRLSVELYIDTGEREKNEDFFDRLYEQREVVEKELGMSLSWERMEGAQACRVAVYRDGSINTTDDGLVELCNWAVQTLIQFSRVFANKIRLL